MQDGVCWKNDCSRSWCMDFMVEHLLKILLDNGTQWSDGWVGKFWCSFEGKGGKKCQWICCIMIWHWIGLVHTKTNLSHRKNMFREQRFHWYTTDLLNKVPVGMLRWKSWCDTCRTRKPCQKPAIPWEEGCSQNTNPSSAICGLIHKKSCFLMGWQVVNYQLSKEMHQESVAWQQGNWNFTDSVYESS